MRPRKPFPKQAVRTLRALLANASSLENSRRIQAIMMRATGDSSVAEIAAVTLLKPGTVRVLHSRFLREGPGFLTNRPGRGGARLRPVKSAPIKPEGAAPKPSPPPKSPDKTKAARTGLSELARAAGVSRTTVSLALRDDRAISTQTRTRIHALANQLGYRPDPDIHQLMEAVRARRRNHRTNTIAYLTAHDSRHGWQDYPTQVKYHEGACLRASKCGYQIEEFWLREKGMTPHRMGEVIRNRGITGVLLAPFPRAYPRFENFPWHYFSAVALGYSMASPAICRSCNHQFQSMQLLVNELASRGYRRIGLAMEQDHDTRVRHNWRGGYLSTRDIVPGCATIPPMLPEKWDRNDFVRWFEKYRPDAVISAGLEVRAWLSDLGISTPGRLGYANVDLLVGMDGVTGIHQNSTQVGGAAVDLLISLMRSNERGVPPVPHIVMVEGEFKQGGTTFPTVPKTQEKAVNQVAMMPSSSQRSRQS